MLARMPGYKPGDEVRYCHGETDRRAQVTEVTEEGEVVGIAVYVSSEAGPWHIEFGVTPPQLREARTPQDRITDGFFYKQG